LETKNKVKTRSQAHSTNEDKSTEDKPNAP